MSEPIFVDLSESKPTEIESLCMKCNENVSRKEKQKEIGFFVLKRKVY